MKGRVFKHQTNAKTNKENNGSDTHYSINSNDSNNNNNNSSNDNNNSNNNDNNNDDHDDCLNNNNFFKEFDFSISFK